MNIYQNAILYGPYNMDHMIWAIWYLMRKITFYDECMALHERTAYGSRSENIERIDRLDTNRFGTSSGHLIRNLELYLGHKLLISYVSIIQYQLINRLSCIKMTKRFVYVGDINIWWHKHLNKWCLYLILKEVILNNLIDTQYKIIYSI